MAALQRFKRDLNLCFSIFKRIFSGSALFQRAAAARFRKKRRKIFHKVMGAGLLVFTNQVQRLFCAQKGRCHWKSAWIWKNRGSNPVWTSAKRPLIHGVFRKFPAVKKPEHLETTGLFANWSKVFRWYVFSLHYRWTHILSEWLRSTTKSSTLL